MKHICECLVCHKTFTSNRKLKPKYCSIPCFKLGKKANARWDYCVECGDRFEVKLLNRKYSSRKTCSDPCAQAQREKHINYYDPSRIKKLSLAAISSNSAAKMHTPEAVAKRGPSISEAKMFVPRCGRSALGVPRISRTVCLMAPDRTIYETNCIRQFVRDHSSLFSESDLKRRKQGLSLKTYLEGNMTCRAMNGLTVTANGSRPGWKGWTLHEKINEIGA